LGPQRDGWTFADTIYPAFMFIIGVAMAFSMARYLDGREAKANALPRIARRVVLLFGLGLLVNGFPLVLYLKPRYQAARAGILLLGYWAALSGVSVPGYGAGSLTRHGNLAPWVGWLAGRACRCAS